MSVDSCLDALPLALARSLPFSYAYVMIVLAGSLIIVGIPGATFAVGFFTNDLIAETGLSRPHIALCWTCAMLMTGMTMPMVGRAIDWYGGKKVLLLATPVYFLSIVFMSMKQTSFVTLTVTFYMIRVGLCTTQNCALYGCTQWWVKKRGMAMSVVNAIGTLCLFGPSVLSMIRLSFEWRETVLIEGAIMVIGVYFLGFFLLDRPEKYGMRTDAEGKEVDAEKARGLQEGNALLSHVEIVSEEDEEEVGLSSGGRGGNGEVEMKVFGLEESIDVEGEEVDHEDDLEKKKEAEDRSEEGHDDGKSQEKVDEEDPATQKEFSCNGQVDESVLQPKDTPSTDEIHWRWQDALCTGLFVNVTLASFFSTLLWSGFNFHYVEIIADCGFKDPLVYPFLYPVSAAAGCVLTIISGPLVDRMSVKSHSVVLGEACAILASGTLILMQIYPSKALIFLFGVFFGAMDGILSVGYMTIFASAFGRVDIATIAAVAGFFGQTSVGLGSYLFALSREILGSFVPVFWLIIGGSALFSVGIVISGNPTPPPLERRLSIPTK